MQVTVRAGLAQLMFVVAIPGVGGFTIAVVFGGVVTGLADPVFVAVAVLVGVGEGMQAQPPDISLCGCCCLYRLRIWQYSTRISRDRI